MAKKCKNPNHSDKCIGISKTCGGSAPKAANAVEGKKAGMTDAEKEAKKRKAAATRRARQNAESCEAEAKQKEAEKKRRAREKEANEKKVEDAERRARPKVRDWTEHGRYLVMLVKDNAVTSQQQFKKKSEALECLKSKRLGGGQAYLAELTNRTT